MEIVDDEKFIVSKFYRVSLTEWIAIRCIVKEWKNEGIVTETKSTYVSSGLLVSKKDGEAHLIVDHWKLNNQTVCKVFSTPNLDEHLENLYDAKIFITLDLASEYLQIPLAE